MLSLDIAMNMVCTMTMELLLKSLHDSRNQSLLSVGYEKDFWVVDLLNCFQQAQKPNPIVCVLHWCNDIAHDHTPHVTIQHNSNEKLGRVLLVLGVTHIKAY